MNFVTVKFLVFFVIVFGLYWTIPARWRIPLLLVASYVFYAAWDGRFLILVIASTALDYITGARIYASRTPAARKFWLGLSIAGNLGLLGYFKYAGFFLDSLATLANSAGWHLSYPALHIILPLGISFYSFHTLSYSLDIYFQKLEPIRSPIAFATFVAFFPQLVAGPILRARHFLHQLAAPREWHLEDFQAGLLRFINGFVKKAFVADILAIHLVDPVFANPGRYGAGTLWLAMFGYAVQIYADFSGYSSMAIGTARMLGYHVPENFLFPYLARSFSEFWRRWHISMSTFFRDYIYIPLGGSRNGRARTMGNLAATTLLSGLWHGANWTFVTWGGVHGVCIAGNHMLRESRPDAPPSLTRDIAGWAVTMLLVCLAWVLFRAADFGTAWLYLRHLVGAPGEQVQVTGMVVLAFIVALVDHAYGWILEHRARWLEAVPAPVLGVGYASLVVFLLHAVPPRANPFIYFQF